MLAVAFTPTVVMIVILIIVLILTLFMLTVFRVSFYIDPPVSFYVIRSS